MRLYIAGRILETMESARIPENEIDRLKAVEEYERLSVEERDALDEIADLASRILDIPICLVTFISEDQQLIRGSKGLDVDSTSREVAFCAHTILSDDMFQVEDALQDSRFSDNPLVTGDPNIRFYAGMPLEADNGERLGALCVIDTTPRKLTEDQRIAVKVLSEQVMKRLELAKAKRELEDSYQALNQLSVLRNKLVNVLAHDIRSPLASIRMVMDLLSDGDITEDEKKEFLDGIGVVLDQTDALLENVLEWGKANSLADGFVIINTPIFDVVEDVVELASSQARVKKVALNFNCERDLKFELDPNVFRLTLRNLVNNAIKFTENGKVNISVVELDGALEIQVADEGRGMSPEQQNALFKVGGVSSSLGTQGEKGTGMGLMFVKEMLDKYNAHIKVSSNESGGCTFAVRFPRPQA